MWHTMWELWKHVRIKGEQNKKVSFCWHSKLLDLSIHILNTGMHTYTLIHHIINVNIILVFLLWCYANCTENRQIVQG